jgi:3-hydroxybutyryl-CoA dehydrogenase
MTDGNQVTIIGCGMMGPGIAACAALAGHTTVLQGRTEQRINQGVKAAHKSLAELLKGGLIDPEQVDRASGLLRGETNLEAAVNGSFLVIEAITENVADKQALFAKLDRLTAADVILTSNTSGLRITDIAGQVSRPERAATTHFWFPGHLVPLVEIVMSAHTSPKIAESLRALFLRWGKAILQAIIREATHIVQSGLASPEDIDTAIKMGMGIRFPVWGVLEHIDAVGLDLALSVQDQVLPGLYNSPEAAGFLKNLVGQGNLGYKTGKGFYNWQVKDMKALAAKTGKGFYNWQVKDMKALAAKRDRFIMKAVQIVRELNG